MAGIITMYAVLPNSSPGKAKATRHMKMTGSARLLGLARFEVTEKDVNIACCMVPFVLGRNKQKKGRANHGLEDLEAFRIVQVCSGL